LRAHERIDSLITFKDQVLKEEASRPEGIDIALILHEYLMNHQDYAKIAELSRDFARVRKAHPEFTNYPAAEKALAATADSLQAILRKNTGASDLAKYSGWLAQVDQSFTDLLPTGDPRIPKAHYNLAETLFTIHDYEGATRHYRWIVEQGLTQVLPDAPLKAVGARYEALRENGLIPKEVAARDLRESRDRKLPQALSEWMSWVEELKNPSENFIFESNRALYAQGHLLEAVEKLGSFSRTHAESPLAPASASLALDTLLLSGHWDEARNMAESIPAKKPAFASTLRRVASDSTYKVLESAYRTHDFHRTLELADRYLKRYSGSEHDAEALSMSAGAALAINSRERALNYFDLLIGEHAKSTLAREAALDRGALQEDLYDLSAAAEDYRSYADQADAKIEVRRKALVLSWIAGTPERTRAVLADARICAKDLKDECAKIAAMLELGKDGEGAIEHVKDAEGATRAIWAAVALEQPLTYRQKLTALRALSSGWADLDTMVKFALLPHILVSIPRAYSQAREEMTHLDPLRPKEKWIVARVDALRELENVGAKLMKLPWKRIQGEVLEEVAMLYSDFSEEFRKMPVPKDLAKEEQATYQETLEKLVGPFEKKGEELRSKAALFGSRSLVKVSIKDLPKFDHEFALSHDAFASRPVRVKTLFSGAITGGNYALAAYFLQEAEDRALIPAGSMEAYKAVALAAAGAKPEAQEILEKLAPARVVKVAGK
ncbi:MAG: tetratricopeptide repeat protein, partial [Bdellovibrionota bacterium]